MQKKFKTGLLSLCLFFLVFNIANEVYNSLNIEVPKNSSVPNLDSNCYYTKNQIIKYFNDRNINVVDIVQYSENKKCSGKVVGSNLISGTKIVNLNKVFIISNTSLYNFYFSYDVLAAISLLILIISLIVNSSRRVIFLLIIISTLLNYNSFLISSFRHNTDGSRIVQLKEFNFSNHLTYSNPEFHLEKYGKNND